MLKREETDPARKTLVGTVFPARFGPYLTLFITLFMTRETQLSVEAFETGNTLTLMGPEGQSLAGSLGSVLGTVMARFGVFWARFGPFWTR